MKKRLNRELKEWIVLIVVGGFIYLMGWHTIIIGKIQQAVLTSGIIQPSMVDDERPAAYNFVLEDFEGNEVPFQNFENKVVFVNFWATWCPPCIAEMPDIHSLYQDVDSVAFVMISLDQDEDKARAFIDRKDYTFPTYFLRSPLPSAYDTHAIPTTYLIDKEGIIRVENHGMAKYNTKKFRKLLAELN